MHKSLRYYIIAFQFFALYQQIWSPFIITGILHNLLLIISKIIVIMIALEWIIEKKSVTICTKSVLYLIIIYLSLLISTFFMYGDIQRYISLTYCPVGLAILSSIYSNNENSISIYISAISKLMFICCALNFVFTILNPYGHVVPSDVKVQYFLGGENHIGFPLMVGLYFVLLDNQINKISKYYVLAYIIMQIIAILIIFSGGNVSGTVIALLFIILPHVLLNRISLSTVVGIFVMMFFILIVFHQITILLNDSTISYIIQDVLGKSLTLTGRTNIWDYVVYKILDYPLFGYGIRDTVNLFTVGSSTFSAHNQFLQSLYEGGIIFYISAILLVRYASKQVKKFTQISFISKITMIGLLLMSFAEAPGLVGVMIVLTTTASVGFSLQRSLITLKS